jgi:hemoglobin
VTSGLFDRLLADPALGHFFEAATLGKHKRIVAAFLTGALGGPAEYKGRNMFDAHIGLVDLEHPRDFGIVAAHLGSVMEEAGVAPDLAGEVMAVVGTLEPAFEKVAKARKMIADMD